MVPYGPHAPARARRGQRPSWPVRCSLPTALTYPLVAKIDRIGRVNTADGYFAMWNVAWVADSLIVRPSRLFDANIFYPARRALAFSEANIGAGVVAVPAWGFSGNPFLAHNSVVVFAFTMGVAGAYYLTRYLTASRGAAAVAGVLFAFCPFVFARTAHIQLMMTFGLPFSMLAFHRLVDRADAGARDHARRRHVGAGAVVRLLRHLRGAHGRSRHPGVRGHAGPVAFPPLLVAHRARGGGVDRAHGAVLPALRAGAGRGLLAHAR